MSDRRRRRHSHDNYHPIESSDPVIIERKPQVRTGDHIIQPKPRRRLTLGSKLYNLFKIRRKKVSIIEETPVRRRHRERHIRTLSPSPSPPPPPSPPRGPYRVMSSRFGEDDFYAPLPPKLPPKRRESDPIDHVVDDRPHRPVKVHNYHHDHRNPHEEDDWPQVESSRSPRRERNGERERDRDRGPQYVLVNGDGHRHRHRHHGHEREYERVRVVRPEPVLVDVTDDLVRRAARAEDELHRAQLALERERRYREREERDRERERERDLREIGRIRDHEHRVVVPRTILREPRGRVAIREHGGDVVVVQHRTPVVARPVEHVESLALDRARAEYRHTQRREGVHEEERSRGTAGRRVIVVDGDDLYGGRGRGGGRDTRY